MRRYERDSNMGKYREIMKGKLKQQEPVSSDI